MYHHQYVGAKPTKKPTSRRLLISILILATMGVALVIIMRSGFFAITKVAVNGSDARLSQTIENYLKHNFVFLVSSPQRTSMTLAKKFPELEIVTVSVNMFSKTLTASYKLRIPHFLWCKQDGCFLVDAKGIIFAPSQITQASFLLTVQDNYFLNVSVGEKIPSEVAQAFLSLERALKEKSLSANHFDIETMFSLKVPLNGAGELRFTLQKPIKEQIDNFTVFYDSMPKQDFTKFTYIDLRVKDKVYYQ